MKEKLINLTALSQFKNKILELIPTKTSQLTNDKAFVTNTDLEIQVNEINENINNLGESVADGKALIASAITNKGVSTSPEAAFADMANAIASIVAGENNDEFILEYIPYGKTSINTKDLIYIVLSIISISTKSITAEMYCDGAKVNRFVSINNVKHGSHYFTSITTLFGPFYQETVVVELNVNGDTTNQAAGYAIRRKTEQ